MYKGSQSQAVEQVDAQPVNCVADGDAKRVFWIFCAIKKCK